MDRVNFANTYKDVYVSVSAKNQLEDLVSSCNQGNLAFYSDIKVSLSRIAGGEYEGVKFVGNNTWRKDLEFGGGSYYLNLICDYTYRKVAFYVIKFEFNPQTTNRKLSLEGKNKHNTISITESEIRDMVRESAIRLISESETDTTEYIGEYEVIDGWGEGVEYLAPSLKQFGIFNDIRMYLSKTHTYCLHKRIDNGKYFFSEIVPAPELGKDETKYVPCHLSEIPSVIRQDALRLLRILRKLRNVIS